jgi:hypothetical protein
VRFTPDTQSFLTTQSATNMTDTSQIPFKWEDPTYTAPKKELSSSDIKNPLKLRVTNKLIKQFGPLKYITVCDDTEELKADPNATEVQHVLLKKTEQEMKHRHLSIAIISDTFVGMKEQKRQ